MFGITIDLTALKCLGLIISFFIVGIGARWLYEKVKQCIKKLF
jgi:hypothetical protein